MKLINEKDRRVVGAMHSVVVALKNLGALIPDSTLVTDAIQIYEEWKEKYIEESEQQ